MGLNGWGSMGRGQWVRYWFGIHLVYKEWVGRSRRGSRGTGWNTMEISTEQDSGVATLTNFLISVKFFPNFFIPFSEHKVGR